MKKRIGLLIGALAALAMLSACGGSTEKMTPEKLTQEMDAKFKEVTDVKYDLKMDVDMAMEMLGMKLDMKMTGDMKGDYSRSPEAFFLQGTTKVNTMGSEQAVDMQSYSAVEDNKMVTYASIPPSGQEAVDSKMAGKWIKTETDYDAAAMHMLQSNYELYKKYPAKFSLEEHKEKINDKDVYLLKATVDEEMMEDALNAAMAAQGGAGANSYSQMLEGMDLSKLKMIVELYIDKKDFLPVKNVTKLTEPAQVPFDLSKMMGEDAGLLGESTSMNVQFNKLDMDVNYHDYNKGTKVTVPDEVKNNAITQEQYQQELTSSIGAGLGTVGE